MLKTTKKLVLPLTLLSFSISFASGGNFVAGDDGSSKHPYQIQDAADLKAFADLVNSQSPENIGEIYAVLQNDICLNACDEEESLLDLNGDLNGDDFIQWTPIGNATVPYKGHFDGNGKTIRGLYFNSTAEYAGLFGSIDGATITNLNIEDSYISGSRRVGGIVGYAAGNFSISNSSHKGTVKGYVFVGGVVGLYQISDNVESAVVEGCSNEGRVFAVDLVAGGIIGGYYSDIKIDGRKIRLTIENSHNSATIEGPDDIGGLVGNAEGIKISKSYNSGLVKGYTENQGQRCGGLVGLMYDTEIIDSYNQGRIECNSRVGGLVGDAYESDISKSYNSGKIGQFESTVGSLVGFLKESSISNCFNTGKMDYDDDNQTKSMEFIGSLVGFIEKSSISSSYDAKGLHNFDNSIGAVYGQDDGDCKIENTFYVSSYCGGEDSYCKGTFDLIDFKKLNEFDGDIWADTVYLMKMEIEDRKKDLLIVSLPYLKDLPVTSEMNKITVDYTFAEGLAADSGKVYYLNKKSLYLPAVTFVQDGENTGAMVFGYSVNGVNTPEVKIDGNIEYKRTFLNSGSGLYSTVMLPFSAKVPEGLKGGFHKFEGMQKVVKEKGTSWQVLVNKNQETSVKANTPYLFEVNEGESVNSITFAGGTFAEVSGMNSQSELPCIGCGETDGWNLVGAYEFKNWAEDDTEIGYAYGYATIQGNDESNIGKFGKIAGGAYIFPMRAYLKYNPNELILGQAAPILARAAAPAVMEGLPEIIEVVMVDLNAKIADGSSDESTTRVIGTINTRTGEFNAIEKPSRYFDLKGRYLGNKMPKTKGTYYNNGEKVIIK